MAVGQNVVSAFNGPADLSSFDLITHQITETTIKHQKSEERQQLEQYYLQIREYREGKNTTMHLRQLMTDYLEEHLPPGARPNP